MSINEQLGAAGSDREIQIKPPSPAELLYGQLRNSSLFESQAKYWMEWTPVSQSRTVEKLVGDPETIKAAAKFAKIAGPVVFADLMRMPIYAQAMTFDQLLDVVVAAQLALPSERQTIAVGKIGRLKRSSLYDGVTRYGINKWKRSLDYRYSSGWDGPWGEAYGNYNPGDKVKGQLADVLAQTFVDPQKAKQDLDYQPELARFMRSDAGSIAKLLRIYAELKIHGIESERGMKASIAYEMLKASGAFDVDAQEWYTYYTSYYKSDFLDLTPQLIDVCIAALAYGPETAAIKLSDLEKKYSPSEEPNLWKHSWKKDAEIFEYIPHSRDQLLRVLALSEIERARSNQANPDTSDQIAA